MRWLVLVAVGLSLGGIPVPLPAIAETGCVDTAVDAIQKRYEAVRDLRANFTQISRSVALGARGQNQVASSGTVVLARRPRITPRKPRSRISRATVQRGTSMSSRFICRQTLRTP